MVEQELFAPIEQEVRRRKEEVNKKVEHYESASQQAKAEAGTKSPLIANGADCYFDINAWEAEAKREVISEKGLTSRSDELKEKYIRKYNKFYYEALLVERSADEASYEADEANF